MMYIFSMADLCKASLSLFRASYGRVPASLEKSYVILCSTCIIDMWEGNNNSGSVARKFQFLYLWNGYRVT